MHVPIRKLPAATGCPQLMLKKIDQAIHDIWVYVRENRESLSADVAHRMIAEYISDVRERDVKEIERLTAQVERLKAENKALEDRISSALKKRG